MRGSLLLPIDFVSSRDPHKLGDMAKILENLFGIPVHGA
tara:strand:- start:1013 stop:1129 length:117 start_codon:yes stop_codon:yes gene_type:complete